MSAAFLRAVAGDDVGFDSIGAGIRVLIQYRMTRTISRRGPWPASDRRTWTRTHPCIGLMIQVRPVRSRIIPLSPGRRYHPSRSSTQPGAATCNQVGQPEGEGLQLAEIGHTDRVGLAAVVVVGPVKVRGPGAHGPDVGRIGQWHRRCWRREVDVERVGPGVEAVCGAWRHVTGACHGPTGWSASQAAEVDGHLVSIYLIHIRSDADPGDFVRRILPDRDIADMISRMPHGRISRVVSSTPIPALIDHIVTSGTRTLSAACRCPRRRSLHDDRRRAGGLFPLPSHVNDKDSVCVSPPRRDARS